MKNVDNPAKGYSGVATQTDVTGSRALDGTVYHNTTTKPIYIAVSIRLQINMNAYLKSDSNANPTLLISRIENDNLADIYVTQNCWVLPGNYYKITGFNNPILQAWIEYT
jgi:NRPS condensation-like uncharacterized protein